MPGASKYGSLKIIDKYFRPPLTAHPSLKTPTTSVKNGKATAPIEVKKAADKEKRKHKTECLFHFGKTF